MIVTDIIEVNKSRSKIFLDYEFAFVLYKGELHKYKIAIGQELDMNTYQELVQNIIPKRAKLRAMNLLTKRPYTEEKLREKLREGFYNESFINIAIEYVRKYGYVDDMAYAKDYINYHMSMESMKQMELKLLKKGINHDIIQKCMMDIDKQEIDSIEIEQIKQLIQKKFNGSVPEETKEKAKMMNFFLRKGYSIEIVKKTLLTIYGK